MTRGWAAARLILPAAAVLVLVGCGAPAGPSAVSTAAGGTPSQAIDQPAASTSEDDGGGVAASDAGGVAASDPGGPIGDDHGDRSKGSAQAQVTGGLTSSVDLPFAADLARLAVDGPNTGYLPFTDPTNGTLFLTLTDGTLLVQYAGPDQVALTNGDTPCELHLDGLDANGAKGSFTCKGMLLIKADGMGTADMTGTFEGHR